MDTVQFQEHFDYFDLISLNRFEFTLSQHGEVNVLDIV